MAVRAAQCASSVMSLSVIQFLCLFLCMTVSSQTKRPISFDDALHFTFLSESFNGTWISSSEYIYERGSSLIKYNPETNEFTTLFSAEQSEQFNVTDVSVSADGKWLAVAHDEESVFRHSTTCLYTLIELYSGKHYKLGSDKRIQLLEWAPAGSGLAFVMDNNIYYQSEDDRRQSYVRQITNSSKEVYNGVADWVYEEEVLGGTKALWFSPNGTKIVFATMNDTNVRNFTFWKYGDPGNLDSQYVKEFVIKYPKVGTRNPVAHLNYVDLQTEKVTLQIIKAPEDLVTSDNILGPVSWADENHFSVTWMERLQTRAYTLLCDVNNLSNCQKEFYYREDNGWLDIPEPVWVNSSAFLTVLPQDQGGDHGNYRQLSLVQGGQDVALTSGLSVVTKIDCYDKKNGIVYYSSTLNNDSAKKLVYKMDLNNPTKKECFSCRVKENCAFGSAYFSKGCAKAVLSCKAPGVPEFHVYNKDGELVHKLSTNEALKQKLEEIELPIKENLCVPVPGGFTAKVRLILPPNLDRSGRTKYPVMFEVYSGPDTNKISDAWMVPNWNSYWSTSREIIVVHLDGRGSGLRGDKLKFAIYHHLGGPEIEDILVVGQYLQQKYPFMDPLRMGIWGWSYGGFATAMTLAKDVKNVFRCGISVAPVTNWIYYDTVYTERYMGLPTNDSNLEGYKASDVTAKVENFRNKLFYLIHGNADDNVHYQQSMILSRALELADIMFFQQSYPDETHALANVRRHLYHSMDRFWSRCFHLNDTKYSNKGPSKESEEYYYD